MEVNAKDYTLVQLRTWLKNLNLKTGGNKEELVKRLNEVPVERRGDAPEEDEHFLDSASDVVSYNVESNIVDREFALLQRERDVLAQENELLKKINNLRVDSSNTGGSSVGCNSVANQVSLTLIKELVPEYSDETNFEFWSAQLNSVVDLYKIDENMMRILITSRLTGKALKWLQENINFANHSASQILSKTRECFQNKENKLILRQRFEQRKWKVGESFTDYYNEKNLLSSALQLDEDELIDYIIDGIPEEQLRTQANLQCFNKKERLLQAFTKISLKGRTPQRQYTVADKTNVRCYNCNSIGHMAAECRKAKREYGAC